MNYTMELEGKLHAISVASDKLSSQLSSMNKQESKLRASKADLEHKVGGLQHMGQCLAGNTSDVLASALNHVVDWCTYPCACWGVVADAAVVSFLCCVAAG